MTTENLLSGQDFASAWPNFEAKMVTRDPATWLFVRLARPVLPARATIIITHGLGEHSGRYGHVASALVDRGFCVVGWDLRGHGWSAGRRGDITGYRVLTEDLHEIYLEQATPDCPVFLFGHSLGGQITLRFLEEFPVRCSGVIAASPWLRLTSPPPPWKLLLARVAMRCWPGFVQHTGNRLERMSRDAAHMTSFPDLDLVHHRISARMFFALMAAGERLVAEASRVKVPLLLLHGDADPVTCHRASSEFVEKAGASDKTLRIFPGSRHETHNDLDRDQVIREVADWIDLRVVPAD